MWEAVSDPKDLMLYSKVIENHYWKVTTKSEPGQTWRWSFRSGLPGLTMKGCPFTLRSCSLVGKRIRSFLRILVSNFQNTKNHSSRLTFSVCPFIRTYCTQLTKTHSSLDKLSQISEFSQWYDRLSVVTQEDAYFPMRHVLKYCLVQLSPTLNKFKVLFRSFWKAYMNY